jgi:hypothetical protein
MLLNKNRTITNINSGRIYSYYKCIINSKNVTKSFLFSQGTVNSILGEILCIC